MPKKMTEPRTVKNLRVVVTTEHGSGPKSLTIRKMKNCKANTDSMAVCALQLLPPTSDTIKITLYTLNNASMTVFALQLLPPTTDSIKSTLAILNTISKTFDCDKRQITPLKHLKES